MIRRIPLLFILLTLTGCPSYMASQRAKDMCGDDQQCYNTFYPGLLQQEKYRLMQAAQGLNESNMQQANEPLQFPTVPNTSPPPAAQMNLIPFQPPQPIPHGDGLNPYAPYNPNLPCRPDLGQDCR